jgi:hypothetical protein
MPATCAETSESFQEIALKASARTESRDSIVRAWDRYGFVYETKPGSKWEVWLSFLDSSGTRLRSDVRVSSGVNDANSPAVTWDPTNSRFVVAWVETVGTATNIWAAAYTLDGTLAVSPVARTTSGKALRPDLACNEKGCVVAYEDTKSGTFLIYMKALGFTPEYRVSARSAAAQQPNVEASPLGFEVVWISTDVYGANYTSAQGMGSLGRPTSTDTRMSTSTGTYSPSLAWNGSEFGLVWADSRNTDNEIYATVLSPEGVRLVPEKRVTNDPAYCSYPDLTPSGTGGYNVAFHDNRTGNMEIFVTGIDRWGNPVGSPTQVTNDAAFSLYPTITSDGYSLAVVFRDDRNNAFTAYFDNLTCSCPDPDLDGVCGFLDNCPSDGGTNLWDRDRDGRGDECDNDDDGDGFSDSVDSCPACASTTDPDGDGDGFGNSCDNCPTLSNPPFAGTRRQPDYNMDGEGDRCDADDDGDGINDSSDNCDFAPNAAGPGGFPPSQVDSDLDGVGNACDACTDVDHDLACTECAPPGVYECAPDCAPSDPGTRYAPIEVSGLSVSYNHQNQTATLGWGSLASQAGTDVVYDIVRGTLSSLRQDVGFYSAWCIGKDFVSTSMVDSLPDPVSGDGYWYLVRGYNICGTGSYGPTGSNRDWQIDYSPTHCMP